VVDCLRFVSVVIELMASCAIVCGNKSSEYLSLSACGSEDASYTTYPLSILSSNTEKSIRVVFCRM